VEGVTHDTTFVGDVPMEVDEEDLGGKVFSNVMYDMPPELQRPVMYSTVEWSSTDVEGDVLFDETFPSHIFDLVQNMRFRLANRALFSCDISLKVYLQSVPTQCGALVMTMSPMARSPTSVYSAMSGPHVILSAGDHVSGEIVVPYIRDTRNMLVRSYGAANQPIYFDFVRGQVRVLSPLRVTDATTVKLIICAQILNPVYAGSGYVEIPTAVNQGKEEKQEKGKGKVKDKPIEPNPRKGDSGGKDKGKLTKPETYAKAMANTLTSIASCAVTTAKIVTTGLEIAAMIGLSKPVVEHKIVPFGSSKDLFGPNVDGQFFGYQMGSYFDSKTIPHPLTFGREDPMDISFIARRPGLVGKFNWSTVTTPGDTLCIIPLTPCVNTAKSPNKVYHTPLSLLGTLFRRWRGKLNFRIRLFATKFHAGQLEIIANYGSFTAYINDEDKAACCHRCVLDISNNNQVEIECGFINHAPVEQTINALFDTPYVDSLQIRCLSALTASGDVSSEIDATVEIWSEDIEFGLPGMSVLDVPEAVNQGVFEDSLLHTIEDGKVVLCDEWQVPLRVWDRFASGEKIQNLREVTRRIMYADANLTINDTTPVALMMDHFQWFKAASDLFVFQVGGWRMVLYPTQGASRLSYVENGTSSNYGFAQIVFYTDGVPREPICLNLPNNYKYGVLVLHSSEAYYNKSYIIKAGGNPTFVVGMSLADDASWGGMNYIDYDRVTSFYVQQPTSLNTVS
jgi:hypothetical protein